MTIHHHYRLIFALCGMGLTIDAACELVEAMIRRGC